MTSTSTGTRRTSGRRPLGEYESELDAVIKEGATASEESAAQSSVGAVGAKVPVAAEVLESAASSSVSAVENDKTDL